MNINQLCLNCMADRGELSQTNEKWQPCPYCGFDERFLPAVTKGIAPRTLFQNKYVVGRAFHLDPVGQSYFAFDLHLERKISLHTITTNEKKSYHLNCQDWIIIEREGDIWLDKIIGKIKNYFKNHL
jgi:hypothetical protein